MEGISSPNSLTYIDEAPSYSAKKPELDTISERSGPTTRSQAKSSALLETLKTKLVKKARSTSSRARTAKAELRSPLKAGRSSSKASKFQANSDDSARARTAKAELRSPLKAGRSSSKASAYSRFDTVSS